MLKENAADKYTVIEGKEQLKTDENGELYVEKNFTPGHYQLIEVTAPPGYLVDKTPVEFIIEKDQISVLQLIKTEISTNLLIQV